MDMVTGVLGSLISKLGELVKQEYDLQTGLKKKIISLTRDLESMHDALRSVAEVPPEQLTEEAKGWAHDIRELSYDAEDILDRFLVRVQGPKAHDQTCLKRIADIIRKIKERSKIGGMIKIINKKAYEVDQRHRRYRAVDIVPRSRPTPTSMSTVDPRLRDMYKEVTQLIGIDESRSELKSKLSSSSNKKMKIVSVVGEGGLGKTTLVKAVYDELISGYDCGAFVSVGRDPDLSKVFRQVLIELDRNKYMNLPIIAKLSAEELSGELQNYLGSKRYLIVIDDVWETTSWKDIKLAFVQNNNGSRIITTTRKLEVAKEAGEVYKLEALPSDKSKKLFYRRIFGGEDKSRDNDQPDEVSEKILRKCDGVPLAIITMASLLVDKSREEWIEVCSSIDFRKNDIQQVSDTEWILSLSYYDLPPHLKTCLLYLSVFPEDHIIQKDSLIRKWVAEGFVHQEEGTSLHEVGERYFNELVNRSMIQEVEDISYSGVYGCRVHDMVLDLLRLKSKEQNFVIVSSNSKSMPSQRRCRVRRLAQQNRTVKESGEDHHKDPGVLRSLIASGCDYKGLTIPSFELLRVLALEDCKGIIHLEHIGTLLHLRYLGLRYTHVDKLPEEIGSLKFLQAVELGGTDVKELPSSISLLKQLMYLCAFSWVVPDGVIEKLTSLEELKLTVRDLGQFARELGKLSELRVLEIWISPSDFIDHNSWGDFVETLGKLHKIQHLELGAGPDDDIAIPASLWQRGVLSRHLQRLIVPYVPFSNEKMSGQQLPSSMPASIDPSDLPKLTNLTLAVDAMEDKDLKILGQLPELRQLSLFIHPANAVNVTMTSTVAARSFQKLRYCNWLYSNVQFALNEDSSISFTVWNQSAGGNMVSGSKKREECGVAPAVIMPNLEVLVFAVYRNGSPDNLGLEYLPSLQRVHVFFRTQDIDDAAVEGALRKAVEVHRNRPIIEISYARPSFLT